MYVSNNHLALVLNAIETCLPLDRSYPTCSCIDRVRAICLIYFQYTTRNQMHYLFPHNINILRNGSERLNQTYLAEEKEQKRMKEYDILNILKSEKDSLKGLIIFKN